MIEDHELNEVLCLNPVSDLSTRASARESRFVVRTVSCQRFTCVPGQTFILTFVAPPDLGCGSFTGAMVALMAGLQFSRFTP